jgi:hypothetical protein
VRKSVRSTFRSCNPLQDVLELMLALLGCDPLEVPLQKFCRDLDARQGGAEFVREGTHQACADRRQLPLVLDGFLKLLLQQLQQRDV